MERAYLMDKTTRLADKMTQSQNGEKTKYGIASTLYIPPEEITRRINEKIRAEKDQEVQLWSDLMAKARYEMPAASEQRLSAIVHKQIQQMKHGKKEEVDPELTLKPDCSKSIASKAPLPIVQKRRHYKNGFDNGSLSRYS